MALNSLLCADVPLSTYTLTHTVCYATTGCHLSPGHCSGVSEVAKMCGQTYRHR